MGYVSLTLVIYLSVILLLSSVSGRMVSDVDLDTDDDDDDWPVLCPFDTFYSREKELCLTCSRCPINNIITSPCHGLHDTKCGPFYDFHGILPADYDSPVLDDNNTSKQQNTDNDNFWQNSETSAKNREHSKSGITDTKSNSLDESSDNIQYSDSEWKSLTIALVLASVFLVLLILGVIYFLRRRSLNEKQIACEYSPTPEKVFV